MHASARNVSASQTSSRCLRHTHAQPRTRFVPALLCLLLFAAALDAHFGEASAASGTSTVATQGTIYRCIDRHGGVSYQDTGCSPQQRTSAVRRFTAQGIDPALVARSRAIAEEMDLRNRGDGRRIAVARGGARKPTPPSACETAKRTRKATLDRVGFKRDFALLSRLDNEVWDVCKGF
ncbi:MAG: DUF4124 domain-containing protein [Lysobacter sp.]|nr:DUF4124 domain-containing protein [Lysobacter sp.]